MGAYSLAMQLGVTEEDAEALRRAIFNKYKVVDRWIKQVHHSAAKSGRVRTSFGRIRDIPQILSDDKGKRGYGMRQSVNCVDYATLALTQRGWVRGDELNLTDMLLTKNADSGLLEWQKLLDVRHYPDYDGPLVEFRSRSFSAVTTPNHRWLTFSKWLRRNRCSTTATLSRYGDDRIHRVGEYPGVKEAVYSDAFVEFVGWLMTDGHYKGRVAIELFQSHTANPHKCARIDACVTALGYSCRKTVRRYPSCTVWHIHMKDALPVRKLFGGRRLLNIDFLLRLTSSQLKLLSDTMIAGDGWISKVDYEYYSCRTYAQAEMFQILTTMTGRWGRISWRDTTKYIDQNYQYPSMPNVPKQATAYVVNICERTTAQLQHANVSAAKSAGVWCPSVPNSYWVAKREETVYVTGNTIIQGGAADLMKMGMLEIEGDRQLYTLGYRLLLSVHDEVVGEVPEDNAAEANELVKKCMSDFPIMRKLGIPFPTEGGYGRNWHEAKEQKS